MTEVFKTNSTKEIYADDDHVFRIHEVQKLPKIEQTQNLSLSLSCPDLLDENERKGQTLK